MGLVIICGKVHKEVQIPIVNKNDGDYCKDIMRQCVYIPKNMIEKESLLKMI